MTRTMKRRASYLNMAFGDIRPIWDQMRIEVIGVEYDTIVGTGLSGALVVPTLARLSGKYWAIVRKAENSHSSNPFEGEIGQKWLFVDDLVETGDTRNRVIRVIREIARNENHSTEFVGSYQYYHNSYTKS